MLVRYFTTLQAPHTRVEAVLGDLQRKIAASASEAYREGESLRETLATGSKSVAKEVLLDVGQPRIRRDGLAFPVTWKATGPTMLFPRMVADLVVFPIGPELMSLVFEGVYDPPLGAVGDAIDRLIMNRVAETTVKNWVDRVVSLIEEPALGARGGVASEWDAGFHDRSSPDIAP